MNLIKKALVPAAFVAVFLLALGAMGRTSSIDAAEIQELGAGNTFGEDGNLVGDHAFAVWAIVDDDDELYTVELNSGTGSADIVAFLDGNESGDLDDDINTQEVNGIEPVDIRGSEVDESLEADLAALGLTDLPGGGSPVYAVLVVVECDTLGTVDISFVNETDDDDSQAWEFECRGHAADAEISASPSKVEIVPQYGSTDTSVITVEVFDAEGEAAIAGDEVLFLTDNCDLSDDNVLTEHDAADDETTASVELDCSDGEPGTAEVTAIIEKAGADIVLSTTITVVGPPVPNGFSAVASPDTVVCGEKASIVVTVLDAVGQPVSDLTPVEAVTNFGGVIGGAGTLVAGIGPVSPLSSAVGFTHDGTVEFFVITSDTHVGNYEVLLTTGNMVSTADLGVKVLAGAPFSTQVSIACTEPAPTVVAPDTGEGAGGITPPSTGDAGLAQTSGSSWMVLALAGALASVVALVGVAKSKVFDR